MISIGKFCAGLLLAAMLSSCGVNQAFILNQNHNSTQVELGEGNFKILERVQGTAYVEYVLFFGGNNKKNLYADAYAAMLEKAALTDGPRALMHVLTEEHVGGIPPFYYKRTITVSAHVVEFIP